MNKSVIQTLVHFNIWANDRILAACEQISYTQSPGELDFDLFLEEKQMGTESE